MTDHENGSVRINNVDIYRELTAQGKLLARVAQTIDETLKPGMSTLTVRLENVERNKADKEGLVATNGRVEKLELRVYAIMAGLLAALGIGKGVGLL